MDFFVEQEYKAVQGVNHSILIYHEELMSLAPFRMQCQCLGFEMPLAVALYREP
jgi:hypothetical protein